MDVLRTRQENVDEQVGAASALEEDAERWQEDGEDDLDDVAVKAVSDLNSEEAMR